jgi:glycosyltransferase involved in cell wall biosynthesis
MRIALVGTAYPFRGGISHYNALLYSELKKSHEVDVITFKRQYPQLLFPGKTQQETEGEILRVPSEQLIDSVNPLNWISVGKNLRKRGVDLLIFKYWLPFFGPSFGTIAKFAKRGTRTKVLFICDNVIPHEHRPGDAAFTRFAFNQADFFIVQSETVERDLVTFKPGARYRKVPHPVYNLFGEPVDRLQARNTLGIQRKHLLLFFGYVRPYKGLNVLLQAMAQLTTKLDVELLVVGEFYEGEGAYRNQIRELGLNGNVTLHPEYVSNRDVRTYFSAADVVVLPYLSATQSGIAQIAYNFNKPVIATDVGGLGEVLLNGKTGFLVPPNDAAALADAIQRFFADRKEEEFARNVGQEKEKYTWGAMVRAIESLTAEN